MELLALSIVSLRICYVVFSTDGLTIKDPRNDADTLLD